MAWGRLAGPLFGVGLVLAVTGIRLWLGRIYPDVSPFSLYYPAILAAALFGGGTGGALALVLSLAISWEIFVPPLRFRDPASQAVNQIISLFTASLFAWAGAYLRSLLQRQRAANAKLADRELRYRTLFEGVSEGFALLEGIWDENGALRDLKLIDANPALLRMFDTEASVIGRSVRQIVPAPDGSFLEAHARAFAGEQITHQLQTPRRWFEVRIDRVGDNKVGEIVVDITERKADEQRQTELFDELNHRVKNNLAIVSAMLNMQARGAETAEVKDHLQAAVARIQTIADVHASLYRSSRKDDVDFSSYLHDLCERLSRSLLDRRHVRIELSTDPAVMPLDRAVTLGLVVNELVTNAAKHAYPAGDAGVIEVRLRNGDAGLVLSVSDAGRGLPEGGELSGLGMRLVRSLVQQSGGALGVRQNGGLTFTIELAPPGPPKSDPSQSQLL